MSARLLTRKLTTSALVRRLAGLWTLAAALASATPSHAQAVVAGNTGSIQVLADAGIVTPTTVAVRDGIAFVAEGQLARLGQLGGVFKVVTVALDGSGLLNDVIRLPGNDFFPEGITLDPVTNDLFIGSIFNGRVVKVPAGSLRGELFAARAPAVLSRGAVGSKVDNARGLLWVCDTNLGADPALPGGTLTGLSLVDGSVVVTHDLGAAAFCNDIALDVDGSLFVTETAVGQVFRLDAANALTPNSLELFLATPGIAANGGFGANGLVLTGSALFVANTSAGTIVRFDPAAADVAATETVVAVSEGNANVILSGPDGMLALSDTQVLVVENGFAGAGLNRLVLLTLDPL
jgi:sugar lactone lactonase YvrE